MAKQINISEAASWSEEETQLNLTYLETRGRFAEADEVRILRGEPAVEETTEAEVPMGVNESEDVPKAKTKKPAAKKSAAKKK